MAVDTATLDDRSATASTELDLTWMPAWRIRELIGDRVVTPTEVLEHFIARIEKLEPTLHAFYSLDFASARAQAAEADHAVEAGEPLGPLHGIPTAAMDGLFVEGMPNPMWHVDAAGADDLGIERVRNAGAIFVGATNTYHWNPTDRPRNPWNLDRDPGNSSRGSAVAVAAGMLPVAIGMDGAGSTRLPAAWSGLIGVHPSRGLVPTVDYEHPSLTLANSMGPMARDARDAALLLQVMAGPDGRDPICLTDTPLNYTEHLFDGVDGLHIAWTDDYGYSRPFWVDGTARLTSFARNRVFALADRGAVVEASSEVWEHHVPAMLTLGGVFAGAGYNPPIDVEELAERGARIDAVWGTPDGNADTFVMPALPQWDAPYRMAADSRKRNWDAFERVFESSDVLISTTTPMPPQTLRDWGMSGRHHTMAGYSAHSGMYNHLGIPAVNVPIGFIDGLPVGVQVAARPGREDLILRVVQALQDAYPITERPASAR
ncbi:amidase [Microbacterium esteraromaticum]|uniref:amidase n=1 Tax=Microbacterium esteraromaticum TaxID=57043 RepID=UPI001CD72B14|nr:amidase [Microbacterium esteraromaticum]MCA1307395.1 amidase [Microbacterium esteraromaticum]